MTTLTHTSGCLLCGRTDYIVQLEDDTIVCIDHLIAYCEAKRELAQPHKDHKPPIC